ncbi:MAG TPA: hypothetical protein PLE48_02645 [Thiobacillus sp.]|nr:MAG: hypothetical protein B7Y21_01355 [Hydrogenophilales bacterium 16-61-112]OZA43562.1 MAG: hypothetical protein B7X81_11110 [Hydrogenophilales bacterium 17-61-76]HQT30124.1 hypothetical protein [Thiobacillus sp.]HQT69305.1 hypothetical protein [Thiobacillus sp.]
MNRMTQSLLVAATTGFLLSACATPPKTAATKTYHVKSQKLVFGGTFSPDANELIITVNDDPIMKGGFPPYTPTQNLNGSYKNIQISAHCYFGSVLGSKGGKFGLIAGMIQSANSSSADKCDLTVNAKAAETLYF